MTLFPKILIPDFIDIESTGDYGVLISVDETGSEKRVTEETHPINFTLGVRFEYLNKNEFDTFISFYDSVTRGNLSFSLPNEFFDLCNADFERFIRETCVESKWVFARKPVVEIKYRNFYTATFAIASVKDEASEVLSGGEKDKFWGRKISNSQNNTDYTPIYSGLPVNFDIPNKNYEWTNRLFFTYRVNPLVLANNNSSLNQFVPTINYVANSLDLGALTDSVVALPHVVINIGEVLTMNTASGVIDDSYINTDTTLKANTQYYVDTSLSAITVTLPLGRDNDWVRLIDFAGKDRKNPTGFGLNNLTVLPQGADKIQGHDELVLDQENNSVYLYYYFGVWRLASTSS